MQPPSPAQIRTAIEVLKKFGERLNEHAEHAMLQLPESPLGDTHAGRIKVQALEQISRSQQVAEQLEHWREELHQERRQCVSHHV